VTEVGPDETADVASGTSGEEIGAVESTGHPVVDEVLASLEGLDHRPVDEHVPVFEAAHDRLRGVLSEGGDRPSGA